MKKPNYHPSASMSSHLGSREILNIQRAYIHIFFTVDFFMQQIKPSCFFFKACYYSICLESESTDFEKKLSFCGACDKVFGFLLFLVAQDLAALQKFNHNACLYTKSHISHNKTIKSHQHRQSQSGKALTKSQQQLYGFPRSQTAEKKKKKTPAQLQRYVCQTQITLSCKFANWLSEARHEKWHNFLL